MWILIWLQPIVAVAGLVLAGVVATRSRWPRAAAVVQAAAVAGSALGLAIYVASEDAYRGNGISRWEAYDAHELTVVAVAAGAAAALVLSVAAARDRRRLAATAFLGSSAAAVLGFTAFLANSLN